MDSEIQTALYRLAAAAIAGGIIGIERAFHGRPAGFRTHILVCMASSLLMLLMQFQWLAVPLSHMESVRVDPTRMAQGIMTGIGFLGAGVIMQERHMVRGLTTAASIWITSAIGIILGSGFFAVGALAAILTLLTLSLFRWFEGRLPGRMYARVDISLTSSREEPAVLAQMRELGLSLSNVAYKHAASDALEVQLTVSAFNNHIFHRLLPLFESNSAILEFSVRPLE